MGSVPDYFVCKECDKYKKIGTINLNVCDDCEQAKERYPLMKSINLLEDQK